MCTMCTCSGSKILKNGEFDSFLILQAIYFVEKCEVMFLRLESSVHLKN